MTGPLNGVRILEFAGMGPGPFAAMMLADMGAEVVRIDRSSAAASSPAERPNPVLRGRRSISVNLKSSEGVDVVRRLIDSADALIEGFRPGVMERFGLGPDVCLESNPGLVYGRVTGWGQTGPYARLAGHDINYIAVAGALEPVGRAGERPVPPLNLVGDYGGGAMYLAFGLVCALYEARSSGRGQVVDAAMVDGAASLMTSFYWMRSTGIWNARRGTNKIDSGAHFYDVYETADGCHVAVGAIEPRFYAELRRVLELDDPKWDAQLDRETWSARSADLAEVFRTRTRDEWCEAFAGADACFAPVLSLDEAPHDEHNKARGTFVERDGIVHPAPAPRLSRTPGELATPPAAPGRHTDELLGELGLGADEIEALRTAGAVG